MNRKAGHTETRPNGGPKQQRSRESEERILRATERLLIRAGTANFTLVDVSREAKMSVGNIYRRFTDKDALMIALQERVNEQLDLEYLAVEAAAAQATATLERQVAVRVVGIANLLKRHEAALRAIVEASWSNTTIARRGVEVFHAHSSRFKTQLLRFRGSIAHRDPEHALGFCFNTVYELVASHFGFGRRVATDENRWSKLLDDLQRLSINYLMVVPRSARRSKPA